MSRLSGSEIASMGRQLSTPFHISILKNNKAIDFRVDSILRIVPGRRFVAVGTWQEKTVILKLFFDQKSWKTNIFRDVDGIRHLKEAGIPTAELVLQTTTEDSVAGALLFEYLETGEGLSSLFEHAEDDREQDDILHRAITSIASCHRAGLWQADIHLDNFMLYQDTVHVIDGGDIKFSEGSLNAEVCLNNMALFLAQLAVRFDQKSAEYLQLYYRHMPELRVEGSQKFQERITAARINRLDNYEKKLFRSTTAHCCERIDGKFVVYDRSIESDGLQKFIIDPDSFIVEERLMKKGNSSTLALVEIGDSKYVLKRYNMKGFWHRISRSLRPSRAHHSWRNALILKMLGIETPMPYLFMEKRILGVFRSTAYYLSEWVDHENFGEEIDADTISDDRFELAVDLFRQMFSILSTYRISHGDTKASNFIIRDGEIVVLDLDSMKRHGAGKNFEEKRSKDLGRFRRNWNSSRMQKRADEAIIALEREFTG
jgi:tRNA A-37 threonylcarbamoyl transferase component Bud32